MSKKLYKKLKNQVDKLEKDCKDLFFDHKILVVTGYDKAMSNGIEEIGITNSFTLDDLDNLKVSFDKFHFVAKMMIMNKRTLNDIEMLDEKDNEDNE